MVALLVLVLALAGLTSPAEEVGYLERERIEAMIRRDAAALERILADDLIYTHSSGRVQTKGEFIQQYTATDERYALFDAPTTRVRVYGDTAILTGAAKVRMQSKAGPRSFEIRFIDVWVRRSGRWQMVAWQSTRISP